MDADESRQRAYRNGDAPQRQAAAKRVIDQVFDRQVHAMAIARHGGTRLTFGWGWKSAARRQPSHSGGYAEAAETSASQEIDTTNVSVS
jgi:hypothetical protein